MPKQEYRNLFEDAIIKYREGGKEEMMHFLQGMYRAGLYDIKAECIAHGINDEAAIALQAFAERLELLKKLGTSPEDIARFQALFSNNLQLKHEGGRKT